MKRALSSIGSLAAITIVISVNSVFAEGFTCEMDNPRVRISIPGLPAIKMEPHPMRKLKPHCRLQGSSGPYTISILTPTCDAGMTPAECASSQSGWIISQFGLGKSHKVYKVNKNTFLMMYKVGTEKWQQINAWLFSGCGGKYCIDIHISRMSKTSELEKDFDNFWDAFERANISER